MGGYNPRAAAEEIVEVLARNKVPIALIDSTFDTARGFARQYTAARSLHEEGKKQVHAHTIALSIDPAVSSLLESLTDKFIEGLRMKAIEEAPTCVLASELEKREAVQRVWVEPYKSFEIINDGRKEDLEIKEGAAVILVIWD